MGRVAGARDDARRPRDQHLGRRRALARLRLGGRVRRRRPSSAPAAARGRLRVGRGAGRAARGVGARSAASTRATSCTARTSTWRCGCGWRAGASASCRGARVEHDYDVRQGRLQVVPTSSATAGGRCSAPTRAPLLALLAAGAAGLRARAAAGRRARRLAAGQAARAGAPCCARCRGRCARRRAVQAARAISRGAFAARAERVARLAVPRRRSHAPPVARAQARLLGRSSGGRWGGSRARPCAPRRGG